MPFYLIGGNVLNLKEYKHQWYVENKERLGKKTKQWYLDHIDKVKEYDKKYYQNNKERIKARGHQYYLNNKEKIIKLSEIWSKNNPDKIRKYAKKYRQNNKEIINIKMKQSYYKYRKGRNKYIRNKYKTDPKYNLNEKISLLIRLSLKGNKNGKRWESIVGYNLNDLIKHLKKTMPEGYSWQDYLEGKLHIDHIIPISVYNFNKPEHADFKRCWALNNLRLLPAKENLEKNNKLYKPFQPALAI